MERLPKPLNDIKSLAGSADGTLRGCLRRALVGSSGGTPMSIVVELWRFMRARKRYWLLPVLIMMCVFGGLVVLSQGSAVAPFIYTLF